MSSRPRRTLALILRIAAGHRKPAVAKCHGRAGSRRGPRSGGLSAPSGTVTTRRGGALSSLAVRGGVRSPRPCRRRLAMLFEGLKLLFSNWRLTLIQVLPAMWIWAAMVDLKAHVLHGKSLHELRGPVS